MEQIYTYSSDYPPSEHNNLSSINFLIATILFGIPLLAIIAFFVSQNLFNFLEPSTPQPTPLASSVSFSSNQTITGTVSQISRQKQNNRALGYITINNTRVEIYPDTQIIDLQNNLEDFSYIQESDNVTVYINQDRTTESAIVALRIIVSK